MKTQFDLAPVFIVKDHGETQSTFWCGFCKTHHYHGRIESGEFDSRVAHCQHTDSPLRIKDYYITKDFDHVNSAMLRLWQEVLDLRDKLKETP